MTSRRDFLKLIGIAPVAAPAAAQAAITAITATKAKPLVFGLDISTIDWGSIESRSWNVRPEIESYLDHSAPLARARIDECLAQAMAAEAEADRQLSVADQMAEHDLFEPEAIASAS